MLERMVALLPAPSYLNALLFPRDRQLYPEPRIAGSRMHLNASLVLAHDSLHCIESQAGAFAHAFGGEKGLKDMRLDIVRDSRAGIADLNNDAAIITRSAYAQRTASMHRVNRIVDDVGPHLVQLAAE